MDLAVTVHAKARLATADCKGVVKRKARARCQSRVPRIILSGFSRPGARVCPAPQLSNIMVRCLRGSSDTVDSFRQDGCRHVATTVACGD
jgi:hypothetical protein